MYTHTHTHTHTPSLTPSFSHRMSNQLEFIDTADMTTMNSVEHAGVASVEWDPTGRYVVSAVSYWTQKVKKGKGIYWREEGREQACVHV